VPKGVARHATVRAPSHRGVTGMWHRCAARTLDDDANARDDAVGLCIAT
jgi:hypothetical protein